MIEEEQAPLLELALTPEQVEALALFARKRDQAAQMVGIALMQLLGFAGNQQQAIAAAARDEQQYVRTLMQQAGLDPDVGTWALDGTKLIRKG